MADTLHKLLPEVLVTKQNLIDDKFAIDKKFVMVDSRAYTEEAFEYILKLADLVGSLVFVYDTKKIWANGRYFGGDIFQEDLQYFTEFVSIDKDGNFTGFAKAHHAKETLILKGIRNVGVYANYDEESGENSIIFDYNLQGAVNTERVDINGSKYNLVVENGQVKLNQYIPMKVSFSTLPPLEYDSVVDEMTEISFKLFITGTLPDPNAIELQLNVTTIDGDDFTSYCTLDEETNTVTAQIPTNVDTKFTVYYSDGETTGTVSTWQRWGYEILIGLYKDSNFGFEVYNIPEVVNFTTLYDSIKDNLNNEFLRQLVWVPGTKLNVTLNIDINPYEYGIIYCPYNMNLEFTDMSMNLTGGWQPDFSKTGTKYYDEHEREYIVWRTDHMGIGLVNWKITGEEIKNTENEENV